MFIDIHCHLDFYHDNKIKEIIERARKKNVKIIVNNAVNPDSRRKTMQLAGKFKEVKAAVGIYPIDTLELSEKEISDEIHFMWGNKDKIIAIGEVGIDLKESSDFEAQKKNFEMFVRLAKELDKPLIVHSRQAEEKVIDILEERNAMKVIMHCFNGNMNLVERIVKNKWMLSIPTIVTFSEHFQKVVERVPIENLLCETDSPFLHPVKGKRDNEPGNVVESYKKIAEIKCLELKYVEEKIYENFERVFC